LVDGYYMIQEMRKRANNQILAMAAEPHTLIGWLAGQNEIMEGQIKRALDTYTDNARPVGTWLKSIYGIGPVIAAGLLAHIDIKRAPTVGHIWAFAGLDPSKKWKKSQKRRWNAGLKTLCCKAGQSFMKFHKQAQCVYGAVYVERKAYEIDRNERGGIRPRPGSACRGARAWMSPAGLPLIVLASRNHIAGPSDRSLPP
jgi:hypothetical protein